MSLEVLAAITSLIATVLSGVVSAVASKGSVDLIEVVSNYVRTFFTNYCIVETPEDGISKRIREVRMLLIKQDKLAKAYSFASGILTFGQFVIGGLLASSFLQESLSKSLIGGLGLLVLVSSLIRQYYRPDIQAYGARRRVARLKDLIRKAEDQIFLIEEKVPEALPRHEILKMLTDGLAQIEEAELEDSQAVARKVEAAKTKKQKKLPAKDTSAT